VDGAADGGVAPASSASSDAKARENLRRIGDVTRRLRHMRVGVPTRLGVGIEVLGMFTGSDMGEAAVDWARSAQSERRAPERASTMTSWARLSRGACERAMRGVTTGTWVWVVTTVVTVTEILRTTSPTRRTRSECRQSASPAPPSGGLLELWQRTRPGTRLGAREGAKLKFISRVVSRRSAPRRTDAADVREPPAAAAACAAPWRPPWLSTQHEIDPACAPRL